MSYRISYDAPKKVAGKGNRKRNLLPLILSFSAIVLCLTLRAMGVGRELLAILLPGDPERTAVAVGTLIENLHSGEAVSQVFWEFCVEIIEGGRMY